MSGKTVFVIGAGASKEVNLPTGEELKTYISHILDLEMRFGTLKAGDELLVNAFRSYAKKNNKQDINDFITHSLLIREALPLAISIDNFIDAHRENQSIAFCSKLAITRAILNAEKNSLLHPSKLINHHKANFKILKNTWYLSFFRLLTENCSITDLKARFNSLTLIIFNYDRCIEQFLLIALMKYYNIDNNKALELINYIEIYHPYGSVGNILKTDERQPVSYGTDINHEQLLLLSNEIRTFTEGTDKKNSNIISIKDNIRDASKLIFLGFAFNKLNMDLLRSSEPTKNDHSTVKCYATSYGISESDIGYVKESVDSLYHHSSSNIKSVSFQNADTTCSEFFSHFWKSLSF